MRPTSVDDDAPPSDDDAAVSAGQPGLPAGHAWAGRTVGTDFPALDDVLAGTVDIAGTFRDGPRPVKDAPQSRRSAPQSRRPAPRSRRSAPQSRRAARLDHSRRSVLLSRRLAGQARSMGSALRRRRAVGVFARRTTLLGVTAVALVAGIGAGAGIDAAGRIGDPDVGAATASVAVLSPEECASAQVAWSRGAAAQVRMDAESPESLRRGFVGARDALAVVTPPGPVAADWDTVAASVTAAADAAEEADDDAVAGAVAEALASLDMAAMTAASQRVTDFLGADCTR